ncbi:MAG: double zinc ribbon domain-containing protein [Janthinobacterium lividum]
MISTLSPILSRFRNALALLLILGGAAGVVAGTLGPWATFRVFHNIEINLPGIVFLWGSLCLAVAVLVFLGMRRSPILCLIGALLVLHWDTEGQKRVPERVKFQLAGSQLELSASINRLLDQFHIPDIEVANLNTPNPELLGVGLGWTTNGAYVLLLGSLVGLPGDPIAVWVYRRTARARCRVCQTRWLLSRAAQFCPNCGASVLPSHIRVCPHCGTLAKRSDRHCVTCGTELPSMNKNA